MVVVLAAVVFGFAGLRLVQGRDRQMARQAAQVFARDLRMARAAAARGRERVVIRFYEGSRWYAVSTDSAELVRRRFNAGGDVELSAMDLALSGDSVVFDARGFADLGGGGGTLATASFTSGGATYDVDFNSLGASRVATP